MMALVGVALAVCVAVSAVSDQIRAGDLAAASGAFATLDPAMVAGWAPAPGVRRVFPVAELRRIAARLGALAVPDTDLCVERTVTPLDAARVLSALRSGLPEGEVELLEVSRAPAPEGELVFPANRWRRAPGGGYFWNGYVRYAGTKRFAVWAKVAIHARIPVVVATTDLKSGRPIEPAQIRVETRDDPLTSGLVRSVDEAVGKYPRRPIRAGIAISAQWLDRAPEVLRGDRVKVEVWSGAAHLELDARAEAAAALGQRVPVRNPDTQRRFFARVEGKARASVGAPEPHHEEKP